MNKKYFSVMLMGAMAVASVGTFTSCKDYDDDIQNLQSQIDANRKSIETIEALIKSGSVITKVDPSANGVVVTLSNGQTFNIANGKDGQPGADGTAWTINEDGYWVKDGKATTYKAIGEKGEAGAAGKDGADGAAGKDGADGAAGAAGKDGKYYVPNAETGTFWVYGDGDKAAYDSKISYLGTTTVTGKGITAVLGKEDLILNGVEGVNGAMTISLTGDLRSLVFKPYIYFDGIETIKYPWLGGNFMKNEVNGAITNRQGKTVKGTDDWVFDLPTYAIGTIQKVDYHMNPANAKVEKGDVLGFTTLNSDIYYTSTRTAEVVPVVKYNDAKYMAANGILSAGLEIDNADKANQTPTAKTEQKGLTVALQAKNNADGADKKVTSDYALVMPVKAELLGIAWNKKPTYILAGANNKILGDMDCLTKKDLVYDTPKGALQNKNGAALEIYYNDQKGISLIDYLSVHYKQEILNNRSKFEEKNILPESMSDWKLSYEFKLVDYAVDGNETGDSKYAKMLDSATGQIRACNVKADGTEDPQSATSVDKEPLVQVLVKHDGKVVLDGYILLHITSQPLDAASNKIVTAYDETAAAYAWDLCDDANLVRDTNWSEFSKWILTDALTNMTKEQFDQYYVPDVVGEYKKENPAEVYTLNQYAAAAEKGGADAQVDAVGTMTYYPNTLGTTNHRFDWTLTAEEIETLTHHKAPNTEVELVRYFRFKAVAPASPYPYVYVKVKAIVKRNPMIVNNFTVKNVNYWYAINGSEVGEDAIVFDVKEPRDGADINSFANSINSTLKAFNNGTENKSQPAIKGSNWKYYFVPKTYTITALNGKTYTITTKSSALDATWNVLECKYLTDNHALDLSKTNTRAEIDATINDVVNKCAIKYTTKTSAFDRTELYAVNGAKYTKIADLDPATGEIELVKNEVTKDVLNAIGFTADHANINTEMRAWVGLIVQNNAECDLATQVKDETFLASWQRPINMIPEKVAHMIDANTNGNSIYAADMFKLYDWRGIKAAGATSDEGQMWGDNYWFWAYYGVNKITINVDPTKVKTNMHFGGENGLTDYEHTLADATTAAELYVLDNTGKTVTAKEYSITFDLSSYNSAAMNAELVKDYFTGDNKKKLGGIFYKNNGDNVTEFTVVIPVTISYTWGDFTTMVPVIIKSTLQ